MAGLLELHVNINPPLGTTAGLVEQDNIHLRPCGVDEDDSSTSSSSTDVFDRSGNSPSSPNRKSRAVGDGKWQRYGSLESATSTGITSMCSSVAADDKLSEPSQSSSIGARKRMSDGSLKQPNLLRLTTKIDSNVQSPQQQASAGSISQTSPPSTFKRNGGPPKDRASETMPAHRLRRASVISKMQEKVRPRSSLPSRLPVDIFASQCIEAAYAARLDPYALHSGEHELLANLLMSKEVTVYLNIRNAILRLWARNPLCIVTPEEAAGCAKDVWSFGLAEVAYKWLVRQGCINFGCVEVPRDPTLTARSRRSGKQKTVVVIGAGVSGLTAARQLESLFIQDSEKWTDIGERPPRVILLEGRKRVGGRVYSKPFRSQVAGSLPGGLRNTAEMGAMIVTGFEHGNPLDTVIRGQLGLRYHLMKDALTIYDCDGKAVDERRDMANTELYTDISDRAGDFRAQPQDVHTLKGDEELISRCRDPLPDGFQGFQLEPLFTPLDPNRYRKPASRRGRRRNAPPGTEKLTGRSQVVEPSNAMQSAARAAKSIGWELKDGVGKNQSISLHRLANASQHPTLGTIMDGAIEQYKDLIKLTPQDMRLLNWHHANLEYANAAPVSSLSLSGHDQDTGNEFEGRHSEIIGGYTQLPRGLMNLPTKLDVRFDRVVESIHYNEDAFAEGQYTTKVVCTNGEVVEADEVVLTAPLGVLKSSMIDFDPPLPSWKRGAINRMGFGLLNKVILLYDRPFWDDDRDMFGLLNDAERGVSVDPVDYAEKRGRFYLIWNATKTSGRPTLVALMAGHAAQATETTPTHELLSEIQGRLTKVFPTRSVPPPLEVIVTRWRRDPFTRGTYSFVAPETRPGDYDLMAQSVGNLHFAGEATCGTHPATVHGAFLSGLRVASEVMECLAGPINLPSPLVTPSVIKQETLSGTIPLASLPLKSPTTTSLDSSRDTTGTFAGPQIKQEADTIHVSSLPTFKVSTAVPSTKILSGPPSKSVCSTDPSFWAQPSTAAHNLNHETLIIAAILSRLGDRPPKPTRPGVNPFLLFTKDKWDEVKSNSSGASAGRDAIRASLGKMWKAATEETKRPYVLQSQQAQAQADEQRQQWVDMVKVWDEEAAKIRREFGENQQSKSDGGDGSGMAGDEGTGVSKRKTNVSNCVVLDLS